METEDLKNLQKLEHLLNIKFEIAENSNSHKATYAIEDSKIWLISINVDGGSISPEFYSILANFKSLRNLSLSYAKNVELSRLSSLANLTSLYLQNNQIQDIKPIEKLTNLTSLYLWNNQIQDIKPIEKLTNLTSLYLSDNQIQDIKPIEKLTNLTSLYLSENQIQDIKPIEKLTNLTSLYLWNNQIQDIKPIEKLTNLTSLYLSDNQIQDIKPIEKLTNLTSLDLQGNQIQDIKPIEKLTNLTSLDLEGNQIQDIKPIEKLTNLTSLYLEGNPILNPPLEVVNEGHEAILRYFERKEKEGVSKIREAKLILVGDGSAGKTSLQYRLIDSQAELPNEDTRTRGITITDWDFKEDYVAHIWDFGGQDIYYPVHRFFITENSVFVLLASTRNEHHNFDYWIPTIYQFAGSSPILVGQTCHDGNTAPWGDLNNLIANPSFNIIKNQGQGYFELNLKAENKGLSTIKKAICTQLECLPHCEKNIPNSWVTVRNTLKQKAETEPYISYDAFTQICKESASEHFNETVDYSDCGKFFHNIGVVLWYSKHEVLRNWVILQPSWAMKAVYQIIDDSAIQQKRGYINDEDFSRIWQDQAYKNSHPILKKMLKVFNVAFPKRHCGLEYIIPLRLPIMPDEKKWGDREKDIVNTKYSFTFMPRGLINQVSAELSRYISIDHQKEEIWCNAVNLRYDNSSCQIIENLFDRNIIIKARGKDARGLIMLVKEAFDTIIAKFKGVKYTITVPCYCNTCQESPENGSTFNYDTLQRWQDDGKINIACNESGENIVIDKLLYNLGLFSHQEEVIKSSNKLKVIKIFLASSSELAPDRLEFCDFILRENNSLINKGVYLELERWEDFIDAMSQDRLQEEYNKTIKKCDIFVSLFFSKVGKYTEEEFETAYKTFKEKDKPKVYTYFKDGANLAHIPPSELDSYSSFKNKLHLLGHFPTPYKSNEDLHLQFKRQLEKLLSQNLL